MEPILSLDKLAQHVKKTGVRKRIAVAKAEDENTIGAISQAVHDGIAEAVMVGNIKHIKEVISKAGESPENFTLVEIGRASCRERV